LWNRITKFPVISVLGRTQVQLLPVTYWDERKQD